MILTENNLAQKLMLILLKDFSDNQTITSLSEKLHVTRVGIWKVIKKLEANGMIILNKVGKGKTNTYTA